MNIVKEITISSNRSGKKPDNQIEISKFLLRNVWRCLNPFSTLNLSVNRAVQIKKEYLWLPKNITKKHPSKTIEEV